VPFLFIGSTGNHAGQSLATWAIAQRLVEKGLALGFMKPFGTHPTHLNGVWIDPDAILFKEILRLKEPLDRICPYPAPDEAPGQKGVEHVFRELKAIARHLSTGKDVTLVMGSTHVFFDPASRPISDVRLIMGFMADFILVDRYQDVSRSIYSILSVSSLIRDRMKGVLLNRVPPEKIEGIRNQLVPLLTEKGIPVTTILPEDPLLSSRSLEEIQEVLEGELLWGKEGLDQPVGGMTVGSTDLKGELALFKRVYNKIVLLKPALAGTPDQELVSRRSISGVILTSGQNPARQVLEAAKKANVPLLLVKDDTFVALERLENSAPVVSARDVFKVGRFTEMMNRDRALDRLLQSLGLIS
jgi:BioD-like phosphotransacetylase family protein